MDKRYHRTTLDPHQTTGQDDFTGLTDDIGIQETEKDERGGTDTLTKPRRAVERNRHVNINMKTMLTKTQTVTNLGSMR